MTGLEAPVVTGGLKPCTGEYGVSGASGISPSRKGLNRLASGGFTIVELMIVVAILTILGGLSVPAIYTYLPKYRSDSATNTLFAEMQMTRLKAISRNKPHIVTFDSSAQTITVTVDGTAVSTITFGSSTDKPYETLKLGRLTTVAALPDSPNDDLSNHAAFGSGKVNQVVFMPNGLTGGVTEGGDFTSDGGTGEFFLMPIKDYNQGVKDNIRAVQIFRAGMMKKYRYVNTGADAGSWKEY